MSPWESDRQRKWGNSPSGRKALGAKGVAEWNAASRGKKLSKRKTRLTLAALRKKRKGA